MNGSEFFDLSLSLQAALGAGYVGYVTAYAGFRKDQRSEDALFISMAFASVAMLAFSWVEQRCGASTAVVAAFSSSLAVASVWRKWGRDFWLRFASGAGIHREDGAHAAWSSIVQTDRKIGQVSVHLKNGRVLYLNDRRNFESAPWKGLYLGGDGSVVMAVEEEEMPDLTEEVRSGICDPDWGTRMTYIPAGEIARVNIRMK